jgi:Ni,Fe-hydrogenase I large subunit
VHGIAASIALEDLYNISPTPNGLILRELILGLHLVTDHIFHFYQLTLPDYIDLARLEQYRGKDPRVAKLTQLFRNSPGTFSHSGAMDALDDTALTVEMGLGYVEAINVRKEAGSGLASLGGKVPFCHAILPGGVTTGVTADRLMKYAHALNETVDFIQRFYLPQALALAGEFKSYFRMGVSHGNFYGNAGFVLLKTPLYKAGVLRDGVVKSARFDQITEVLDSSYLGEDGNPQLDKKGAYSWVNALHYDGAPMEVGPLARLAVNRDEGFVQMLKPFKQKSVRSSVMTRLLARAYEADKICSYLQDLLSQYRFDESTINPIDMLAKPTGQGLGMSVAARGTLNHQMTVKEGKVTGYHLQSPSTWNFGPTAQGVRGTVEAALIGTKVQSVPGQKQQGSNLIEVGRIVRSFDPCLACAIH